MKRIITVIIGYAVMAWMIYLITVTARSTPKIWDPYDILGVSRVRGFVPPSEFCGSIAREYADRVFC